MHDALVWIGGGLVVIGVLFTLLGAVGVLRFPDVYTRIHAASLTDTGGASLRAAGFGVDRRIYARDAEAGPGVDIHHADDACGCKCAGECGVWFGAQAADRYVPDPACRKACRDDGKRRTRR